MKVRVAVLGLLLSCIVLHAFAQNVNLPPSKLPMTMERNGVPVGERSSGVVPEIPLSELQEIGSDLPTAQLAKVAQQKFSEVGASTRSAKDQEIYRSISPSVVLILTKDGLGSGSLIGTSGEVITNYHG
jgi:hypothetical protein